VVRQAQALNVPLLGVPLWPHIGYVQRMHDAFELLKAEGVRLHRVCNGDLHLEYVGRWREDNIAPVLSKVFGESAPSLHAPLWRVSYEQLAADLAASTVPCRVCAVTGEHGVKVGDLFDAALVARLSASCDQFGENGEFHTLAEVWEAAADPLGKSL
jgi:diphthamide synthase (EF-2-diphthine--ammonia ligase)